MVLAGGGVGRAVGVDVGLEGHERVGHPEARAARSEDVLEHRAALRRVGERALPGDLRPALGRAGQLALHVARGPAVRRVVARPRARDVVEVRGGEAGGAVGRGRGAARAGGRAAGEDLLDLPGAERVRPLQLLGEPVRVGRREDALPDVAAGLLVVAVARVERRREADVDLRLGHADDPRDAPQRLVLAPEELGQRGALVVEEVDAVEVEDVDGAGAEVRDAVLVLAPEAERRADLGADGVAAALAAGDHDDPALDAVALVPDAARPDDARVVVRVRPLAEHVELDGAGGRVPVGGQGGRRRREHRGPDRDQHRKQPLHSAPFVRSNRVERLRTTHASGRTLWPGSIPVKPMHSTGLRT